MSKAIASIIVAVVSALAVSLMSPKDTKCGKIESLSGKTAFVTSNGETFRIARMAHMRPRIPVCFQVP